MNLPSHLSYRLDSHSQAAPRAWALACLVLLAASLLRPTLFGQAYSPVGLALLYLATILSILMSNWRQREIPSADLGALTLLLMLFWLYGLATSTINAESNQAYLIKAVVAGISTSFCFYVILRKPSMNRQVFMLFARLNALLGWSIVVTSLLLIFFSPDAIKIGHVEIVGYEVFEGGNGDLLLPFSFYYGLLSDYGISRFLGIYRESGIAQIYFAWAFIYLCFWGQSPWWWLGAGLGSILCGSSAVTVSYAGAAIIYFGLHRNRSFGKYLFLGFILGAIALVALYAPGLGLTDKQETHAASLDDRWSAVKYVFSDFPDIIWGHGLYTIQNIGLPLGINAISSVYFYGLIGLAIIVASFVVVPLGHPVLTARYLTSVMPLFMTSMLFQPLVDAPSAFLLLFCTELGELTSSNIAKATDRA